MHRIYPIPIPGGNASPDSQAPLLPTSPWYRQHVGGLGGLIDGFIQSAENRLSQWFWQGINSLPKDYFSKDITNISYQDKSFWEGVFNERIEAFKEQWGTEALVPSTVPLNPINDKETAQLGRLREQTAAGFLQGDLSLKEQLIQLQGLVGKKTLSPQCYESGLEDLKQHLSQSYAAVIEKIRHTFRAELKKQPEFLAECFQGDVLDLLKHSQPSRTDWQQLLNYYRPLMKPKHYVKHQDWLKSCCSEQSLLPPPPLNKPTHQLLPEKTPTTKKNELRYGYSTGNMSKFLWKHAGKLVTFGLAAQVAAVQATGVGKSYDLKCLDNTPRSSCIENRILELSDLFDEMKNNDRLYSNKILPLASEIKNMMESPDYSSISEFHRDELAGIKCNLPLPAVNLIWKGNNCSIKDITRGEYLYASMYKNDYERKRREVFTWIKKIGIFDDNKPYWIVNTINTAKSFNIKNIYYDEYLYPSANHLMYDEFRRKVFTWGENNIDKDFYWVVRMNKSGYFEIRSNYYDEYLYPADSGLAYDTSRRRVFTWNGEGAGKDYFIWKINC